MDDLAYARMSKRAALRVGVNLETIPTLKEFRAISSEADKVRQSIQEDFLNGLLGL